MRNEFKKQAENNTRILYECLGEFTESAWKLAQKCHKQVGICLEIINTEKIYEKRLHPILMLNNSISDLLCCLDSLERGHCRTIENNLRMIFEDYCCALHISKDENTYIRFLKGDHQASNSISYAKKAQKMEEIGQLYGYLSNISHHKNPNLLGKQIVSITGGDTFFSHLKPIDPKRLTLQVVSLLSILHLLRGGAELAEEICLDILEKPYFWTNHY